MPLGFLLVAIGLPLVALGIILGIRLYDLWIDQQIDIALPCHDLASLREVLLDLEER